MGGLIDLWEDEDLKRKGVENLAGGSTPRPSVNSPPDSI